LVVADRLAIVFDAPDTAGADNLVACSGDPMPVPQQVGFYWAKWLTADRHTKDGNLLPPAEEWDVVFVFENSDDDKSAERFRVLVVGAEARRNANFAWGAGAVAPTDIRNVESCEAMRLANGVVNTLLPALAGIMDRLDREFSSVGD
jgi:hypothetical protein